MKASNKVIVTSILTILLVGGGTIAAYADEGTPTESQEVTSSPESTSTAVGKITQTEPSTETQGTSPVATEATPIPDEPATEPGVEPSPPTASPDTSYSDDATENPPGNTSSSSSPTTTNFIKPGDPGSPENPLTGVGPAPYPSDSDQVEIWWAMPWPGNAQNVTWPQAYASSDYLQCSITYQVDTYLKSEAQKFTLDGVLNLGEDYQNDTQRGAISWRFVYGGDCAQSIPPKPDDTRRLLDSHDTLDCEGKTFTHVETYEVNTYVYDEQNMTWVANIGPVTTETPREATEEECPVNTQQTPSPPTTLPTSPAIPTGTSTSTPTKTYTQASHGTKSNVAPDRTTQSLAKTGTDNAMMVPFLLVIAALLFALGTAAAVSARRRN